MTTRNNPENQKPNGPHDLVQIALKATARNPKPWVVVEGAGTDNENIVIDFATFKQAHRYVFESYDDTEVEEMPVDIMRRRDDGVLTTEF